MSRSGSAPFPPVEGHLKDRERIDHNLYVYEADMQTVVVGSPSSKQLPSQSFIGGGR